MKEKKFLFFNLWVVLGVFVLACHPKQKNRSSDNVKTSSSLSKPNIIYILADDLGYGDVGVYGQSKFETPNIDRLAAEGMLFTQHYSGSTVCAPSRSALLTGMHTGHTVVRGNHEVLPEGQYPIPEDTHTLAEALKENGYATGAFGKWGLGFPGSEGDPLNQGFDTFYGYNCQRFGHHYYPHHLWSDHDSIPLLGNSGTNKNQYAPKLIHEKTMEFLVRNKSNPFFLYVASIIPHAELAATPEMMEQHRGKYPPEKSFQGYDEGPEYRKGPYESQPETHAAFAAMVTLLDKQVGEIMDKVKELGIEENTLIIFTSDNGPHKEGGGDPDYFDSNGPFKGYKRDLYEGGIRVPMLAKWEGTIPEGSKTDHISAFWDVFPTFLDLVGASIPENLDGISLAPTLLGNPKKQKKHEYLYWEFHEKGGRQAIRKGDWKAVKYNVFKDDSAIELYDLSKDIAEEHNLADQYPEKVEQFEALFSQARTSSEVFKFDQSTYLNTP
ncbi:arylsulfatase [Flagellimonas sp. MMG031]|uniref:Arylsulfatase n=1 Tax=Flagellimonas sp. MMG031 TaxID=3158549 RepID=A0AAU7MWL1_9FLAO